MWREQIEFLSARNFRVVAPDLRGLGDNKFNDEVTTMTDMARDVAALRSPDAATTRLGRSPAWGPSGFIEPCFLLDGLKCGPADMKSGGSHFPTAWM